MNREAEKALAKLLAILALHGYKGKLDKCTWVAQDRDGEWWGYKEKPAFVGLLGIWNVEGVNIYKLWFVTTPPADASKMVFRL